MKTSKKSKSPIESNSKMSPIAETQEKTTLTDTPEQMRKNFLNCDIQTYEDSLTYAKKVIAMALSNIAYLRALWPESFFVTRYFENMELKVIESKSHPQARILTSWILGVFHALERKYLRRFTFSIHLDPKKPEEVIESYEFEISYNDKVNLEITEIRERAQKMRSNSVRFIRHLIYAAGMIKGFPEGKGFMNIRLFYYDEVTPVDYQPPGFKSSEWFDLSYKDGRVELPVGKLNSFWHVLNFSVNVSKTLVKDYDEYEKAGEVVSRNTNETNETWMKVDLQRAKKLTTGIDQSISSTLEQSLVINSSSDLSGSMSSKDSKSNVVSSEQQIETNQESSDKNVDEKIECECGLNEHGNLRLLKCSVCETKQHAICYRILVPDNESGDEWLRNYKHYCRVCYQQLSLPKPSQVDLAIYRLDDSRVQKFCLLRRVVNYIVSVPEETSFTASSIGEKLGLDGDTVTELLSEMPKFTVNSKKKGAERSMKVSKGDVMAMANEWFTKPLERIRRQNESIKKRSLLESSFEVISNDETSFLTDVTDLKDKSDLSTTVDSTPSEKKVVKSKIKASPKRHRLSVSGFVKIDGNDDYY